MASNAFPYRLHFKAFLFFIIVKDACAFLRRRLNTYPDYLPEREIPLYTTLCSPSVFSISSITPSVATIRIVASAAIVGSK